MAANVAIRAIEPSTVHQIQSGQVIVDLCSVAKELVENSLDAGATSIDVRFKNQGLDSIEVQDNGYGISPQNYETLALKHYTSKLSTYADLTTLQTFGFRGEALSSLCALSHFSVVTCTQEEAPKAKKLEFEASGKLKSTTIVSGHKGTTVIVEDLFYNLPVRRRELERNIKREWGKVINLLNQYACIQTGVKFAVSQQPTKGKRLLLFSTKGNLTTRDNIINVFGVKSMAALITLDLTLELIPTQNPVHKQKQDLDGDAREIRVKGHVSRPNHGEGRQTPDRQMFYVNGRPCGLPQFAKVFNEVYRSYNSSQSPFIFADIQLDTHLYDVNVSPDKRTILLHDQGQMLDNLRVALIELFEKQDITVPASQLLTGKQTPFKKPSVARRDTPGSERSESHRATPLQQRSSASAPDAEREDSEAAGEQGSDDEDDSFSDSGPEEVRLSVTNRNARRASAKRSSVADTGAQHLISRWVERKAHGQGLGESHNTPTVFKAGRQTTPGQKSILAAFRRDPRPAGGEDEDIASSMEVEEPEEASSKSDDESGALNARSPAPHDAGKGPPDLGSRSLDEDHDDDRPESPIPAITPLSQPRPTLPPTTKSLRRPEQQVATIRIGDQEVTGVIGAPPKRPRTDSPSASPARKGAAKPSVSLPSFGGRLTQLFAAGGASQRASIEHVDGENGGDDEQADGNGRLAGTEDGRVPSDAEPEEEEQEEEEQEEEEEDSLFVSQDEEQPMAMEEPEMDALKSTEGARSEDDAEEEQDPAASEDENHDDEEHDDDHASSAESDELDHSNADGDYVDRDEAAQESSSREEEAAPTEPSEDFLKRQQMLLQGGAKRKDSTIQYTQTLRINESRVRQQLHSWRSSLAPFSSRASLHHSSSSSSSSTRGRLDDTDEAEEKLSLKISKSDFGQMKIVGQFNLGFIIAVREAKRSSSASSSSSSSSSSPPSRGEEDDEVFIIDQHASDEKFNFERLQATTAVQSQRLVQPKTLELTAMEEEVVMENIPALEANGFQVRVLADVGGDDEEEEEGAAAAPAVAVGSRVQLLGLPLSRETTFGLADLEELIVLLAENPSSGFGTGTTTRNVPRPSKVRKMFAMRACRSSIMIGRALSAKQMATVVRHMGEMEKPWNCPHGRPTMRHLCGLGEWDERGWREDEGEATDWAGWLAGR